jgi:hypothetical protein
MYAKYLHVGLANLPDEILEEIFAWSDCNPGHLREVSHRFYDIVMSTPRLWAKQPIDISRRKNAFADLALTHSRTQPLRIRVNDIQGGLLSERTLHRLVAHLDRVRELEYFFDVNWIPEINQRFAGVRLVFPRLRNLSLVSNYYDTRYGDDYGDADTRGYYVTFTENWSMPQLDSLSVEGTALQHTAGSNLRRCTFTFGETSDDDCVKRLSSLLVQNATLREFTLALKNFDVTTFTGTFRPVELNHLLKFALLVHKCELSSGTIHMLKRILRRISMPRIEGLRFILDVGTATNDEVDGVTDVFFTKFNEDETVKQVDFSLGRTFLDNYALPLDQFFLQRFPWLEHLTVEAQCVSIRLDGVDRQMPPLRTITFRYCYGTGSSEFKEIIEKFAHRVQKKQNEASGDPVVDADRVMQTGQAVVPLTIILEACDHIERGKLGAISLPEEVNLVWRNQVLRDASV